MATIRDVAAKANVSRSTVSLVLNDSPLVKKETREHVQKVIEELNYVPNNNARSLSNKVMNSLGMIVLSEHEASRSYDFQYDTGLFSQSILNGISQRLSDTDYNVIIEHYSPGVVGNELPKLIRSRRVDGAFIVGSMYDRDFINRMKAAGIPFVIVGAGTEESECDSVWADVSEGSYLSVEYLVRTGHRKICYLNCPRTFRSNYARVSGVERSVNAMGLDFNYDWIVNCSRISGEGGYLAMKQLWESGARPDSMITANAPIAMGAMRYLHEQNVRVPEDISVIAYEDNVLCGYSIPALTAVNIQKECMGETAAEVLLKRLAEPGKPWEVTKIRPYLVERDSVRSRVQQRE